MTSPLKLFCVVLFLFSPPSPAARECVEYLRQLTAWEVLDPRFDLLMKANGVHDFDTVWKKLSRSADFLSFLENRDVRLKKVPESRRVALVNHFFNEFLKEYDANLLTYHQSVSLGAALKTYGIGAWGGEVEAEKTLQRVSNANKGRLLQNLPTVEAEVEKEAGAILSTLKLFPVHNTHHLADIGSKTPVLSSREILRLGLPGGLNSLESFNRRFLASDDQVFFHAHFSRSPEEALVPGDEFGKNGLVLKADYARKHAWVSPYVMYPEDLRKFAKDCYPDLYAGIPKEAFQTLANGEAGKLPADQNGSLTLLRKNLGAFTFTVPDYEATVNRLLLISLSELKKTNAVEYERQLTKLKSSDPNVTLEAMQQLVFTPYKMPSRFEVKVPHALPGEQVIPVAAK